MEDSPFIDVQALLCTMATLAPIPVDSKVQECFALLDHSNSGTISTAGEYARFSRFTVELSCPGEW